MQEPTNRLTQGLAEHQPQLQAAFSSKEENLTYWSHVSCWTPRYFFDIFAVFPLGFANYSDTVYTYTEPLIVAFDNMKSLEERNPKLPPPGPSTTVLINLSFFGNLDKAHCRSMTDPPETWWHSHASPWLLYPGSQSSCTKQLLKLLHKNWYQSSDASCWPGKHRKIT